MKQISKNFTLEELVDSIIATNLKIDNTPSNDIVENLTRLAENMLQPVRDLWKSPIFVSSGYRSPKLNTAVGGSDNSQHLTGEAVDISVGNPAENKKLFDLIVNSNIPFDQLVDEKNYQWIHISYSKTKNRKQILHL